eukprot:scaffold1845_cov291-Prasinococcus_capsulatus_cf.AAC.7
MLPVRRGPKRAYPFFLPRRCATRAAGWKNAPEAGAMPAHALAVGAHDPGCRARCLSVCRRARRGRGT